MSNGIYGTRIIIIQCPMPNAQCPMPNAPFPMPIINLAGLKLWNLQLTTLKQS
ncbi:MULTISPECIES: hypothetical protein [unclassified Nostoc]|uniref:hypothetical protein n=1 Tax=unclassified Nostoc TaxID=2593658 RepID=UPI00262C4061|nr:hypothetical protein [Nostoc sp. S13]MDF5736356.1 hypothetical protein [Nostoc sp. S13]